MIAPPASSGGSLLHRPLSEQDYAAACGSRRPHHAATSSAGCYPFGPNAPAIELRPRPGCNDEHGEAEGRGSPSPHKEEILKPQTGMTIRLTPELLGRLKGPGPKPKIELVLKSAEGGGTGTPRGYAAFPQ